jgi:hypothetical protein
MSNELYINIADSWKEADSIKLNIGDVWKNVESIQINIGDVWKTAWKRKADYFKVRYRVKTANGDYQGDIGVKIGGASHYTNWGGSPTSWTNYTTGELKPGATSWTETECASLQVRYCAGAVAGGEIFYISEIEVDIYDDADNLLDTVKPNADDTLTWDTQPGGAHYAKVDQGVETPNE